VPFAEIHHATGRPRGVFAFEQTDDIGQRHLFEADPVVARNPTSVLLFSGGTDSLCGAIQEADEGQKPSLISHGPSPKHKDVVVADNGWVSVGLPINGQALGTKMSKTTHPRFRASSTG
jgi:hypothetical protein